MAKGFGRYKVAEEIGRGAMGVVYRAVDPVIGRAVAIKAINHAYLESVGVKADEYAARFQREAQVAGALDHVHIVKIYDLGPDYLVMEYVEGETLAARLRARGRLERAEILRIVRDTAEALDYAHARGIVHRDIKPANLMVQRDGAVKVMDFGLARIESSTLTAAGEVLGSASYMAPEVILGQPADGRADTFALAVVAYEMFTGQRPFGGASVSSIIHNVVRQQPRSASELNAALPFGYDAIFGRAFAKDPAGRFPSASAFADALEREAWPHAALAQVASREPLGSASAAGDDPGAGTVLSVDADEVALPSAGESDAGSTTVLVASSEEVDVPEDKDKDDEHKATVVLSASEMEARLKQQAAQREAAADTSSTLVPGSETVPPRAAADNSDDRTQRLTRPVIEASLEARAMTPPPAAEADSASTIIMQAGAPPAAPSTPAPAPAPEVEEEPAVKATVVMKSDQLAAALEKRPAQPPTPLPVPPSLDSLESSAATIVMKSPLASPPPPAQPAPPPVPAVEEEGSAATIVMKPKAPPAPAPPPPAPAAPPKSAPPPPPASAKPAPAPPPPVAPPPAPVAVPAAPSAKSSGGKGLVVGLAIAIPLVFGLTVAAVWLWIRWQNQRAQAPAPEPTAVAAEATPPPTLATPTPEAVMPSPEATPEEPPTPEPTAGPSQPAAEATLMVRSEPVGASVFVGTKKRGTTPLKLRLAPGAAAVRVEKEGYKPWTSDARLKAGESRTLDARLEPLAAPTHAPVATPPSKAAVREGDLVPLGEDVTPPKKVKNVSPNVPAIARKKRLSGSVLIEFVVNVDGTVADPKVLESAGEVLDGAALEAVRQWRYEPATSHGVKVRVPQKAKFTFQAG